MADIQNAMDQAEVSSREKSDGKSGRKKRYFETPDKAIHRYSISLEVACTDQAVQRILSEHGYPVEKLSIIKENVKKVTGLFENRDRCFGAQLEASKVLRNTLTIAKKDYQKAYKTARSIFENNPNAENSLLLKGRRKRPLSDWIIQTETFYKNLLSSPDLLKTATEYGYSETKLSDGLNKIKDLIEADVNHKKKFGEAVEATAIRNTEFKLLKKLMTTFYKIAGAVLADNPGMIKRVKDEG